MTGEPATMLCGRGGAPAGADMLRSGVCPACLPAQGVSLPADENWARDRFSQLAEAVPVGDEMEEGGGAQVFEPRDFESGAAGC